MKKTISFQLDSDLLARLDDVANRDSGNRSELLRRMIEELLQREPPLTATTPTDQLSF